MDLGLTGKHVLVTGGSRGIGLACVQGFLGEGARVSLVSRSRQTVDAAVASMKALGHGCQGLAVDLADAKAAAAMVDEVEATSGPIDVLVNSAGAARQVPFTELTPADFHEAMHAKFFTYIHVMDPVARRMGARGAGVIVNVIGMGGKLARTTHLPGGAANAALMLVTAGMAAAWGPSGVRVNAVNPGATLTERLESLLAVQGRSEGISPEEAARRAAASIPLRRFGSPEEIADTVLYLASSRSSYVNGAIISMDGGATPFVV